MAWKGLLAESKSYMVYPKCGRLKFWLRYPKAFIKFHWCMYKDRMSYLKGDRKW